MNQKTDTGRYQCSKQLPALKRIQQVRTALIIAVAAVMGGAQAVRQQALAVLSAYRSAQYFYVLIIGYALLFTLYVLIQNFFDYRVRQSIPTHKMPRRDYTRHTFSGLDWLFYSYALLCILQGALTVWCFSWASLAVCALYVAAATGLYFYRRITYLCYCDSLTYVPAAEPAQVEPSDAAMDAAMDFYDEPPTDEPPTDEPPTDEPPKEADPLAND